MNAPNVKIRPPANAGVREDRPPSAYQQPARPLAPEKRATPTLSSRIAPMHRHRRPKPEARSPMPKNVPTDIEIAEAAELRPIAEIAAKLGLGEADYEPYGRYKAKLPLEVIADRTAARAKK